MQIKEILSILHQNIKKSNISTKLQSKKISNFQLDSRKISPNDCFIALQGKNTDGHKYISQALNNGAICFIADKPSTEGKSINFKYGILVNNSLEALRSIAKRNFQHNCRKSIGITGTAGKTTTKFIIHHMLTAKYNVNNIYIPPGNLNGDIGTPLAAANLLHPVQVCIFELGTARPNEILEQLEVIQPNVRVLISIGHAHTKFFKDLQGVINAKAEIFKDSQHNILPYEFKQYLLKTPYLTNNYKTFGYTPQADIYIKQSKITPNGVNGILIDTESNKEYVINIPMYHLHILENVAASILALQMINEFTPKMIQSLTTFSAPAGRGQIQRYKYNNTHISFADYTYNANEVSIKNAINTLNYIEFDGPKIFYLGDVLELGKKAKKQHTSFGTLLSKTNIDYIFLQGRLTKYTYTKLQKLKHKNVYHSTDQNYLVDQLNTIIKNYKKIFLWAMGSHGMETWKITNSWNKQT